MPAPYIAIVSDTVEYNPETHTRRDLFPLKMELTQGESELAFLIIEVQNPKTQLSSLEGKRVIVSTGGQVLLDGVISSTPRGLVGQSMTIEIKGTSPNSESLQQEIDSLAETLKVAPYWDPLCVPSGAEDDWAEILAARSQVVAHSRVKGSPFMCDALSGATTLTVAPLKDSLQFDADTKVAKSYGVNVSVSWKQILKQTLSQNSKFFQFETMTPDAVIENFPKKGSKIGNDFLVVESVAEEKLDAWGRRDRDIVELYKVPGDDELDPAWIEEGIQIIQFEKTKLDLSLKLQYDYEIQRVEKSSILVDTNIQDAVVSSNEEVEEIILRDLTESDGINVWQSETDYIAGDEVIDGNKVYRSRRDHTSGDNRDNNNWIEVGETSYLSSRRIPSFFKSERGQKVADHIVERVKARARMASRCVFVSFEAAMPANPHDVTPDCMISLVSDILPGGSVVGRLIRYSLKWNGNRWSFSGTIACAVGEGEGSEIEAGIPEGNISTSSGRLSINIQNKADIQEETLLAAQVDDGNGVFTINDISVPETTISISTTAAPNTLIEQNINIPIDGTINIKQQVTL